MTQVPQTGLPLLKMFAVDELVPARTTDLPARGDRVSFALADGSVTAVGHVSAIAEGGAVKVRLDGIGSFLVPPGYATLVARAQ